MSESASQHHDHIQAEIPALQAVDAPSGPELVALIEALLLVAAEPTTVADLASGAAVAADEVERALSVLEQAPERGWVVQRHLGRVQLATAPRFAEQVRRFLGLDRETRLSPAALETLAIIAYQQPVSRAEIDAVRGVDSSGVLAKLHDRGLIDTVGRRSTAGAPYEYGVTASFLRHFGLRSLDELPPLGDLGGRDLRTALNATVAAASLAPNDADGGMVAPADRT
jgi:segregation and condensation protein B